MLGKADEEGYEWDVEAVKRAFDDIDIGVLRRAVLRRRLA